MTAAAGHVPWTPPVITPIDPDSEHGRQLAADFGRLFAEHDAEMAAREESRHAAGGAA